VFKIESDNTMNASLIESESTVNASLITFDFFGTNVTRCLTDKKCVKACLNKSQGHWTCCGRAESSVTDGDTLDTATF
jgi:hypothetical protein